MRFEFLNQFYPPDIAPTGRYLHDVAAALAARGHEVAVRAGSATYGGGGATLPDRERRDGVEVRRAAGPRRARGGHLRRGLAATAFLLGAAATRADRPDLVVALTSPPLLGLAAAVRARRCGARLAHWVMDLYPDAFVAHRLLRPGRRPVRLLDGGMGRAYAAAKLVVALGPFMARRLRPRVPPHVALEIVSLWGAAPPAGAAAAAQSWRRERRLGPEDLVFLYAGNMGLGHRLGEFLEAARRLGPSGPRWVFAGGGARRAEVERALAVHPQARVELLPYDEGAGHHARLAAADVHLASLAQPWQGVVVPSKVQAAFALGRPVLFVGPPDCEIDDWVRLSGGGWTAGEGDVEGLLAAVARARDPDERARRGAAAQAYAREAFDGPRAVARMCELLERAAG